MAGIVRCPKCGESTNSGGSFDVLQPYKAAGVYDLIGVDDEGRLIVEGVDRGDPEKFYKPLIVCADCGHQWATDRKIVRK